MAMDSAAKILLETTIILKWVFELSYWLVSHESIIPLPHQKSWNVLYRVVRYLELKELNMERIINYWTQQRYFIPQNDNNRKSH